MKNLFASFNQFMNSLEIVFSSSPSTKSHCDCDERFFNCLRWATIFDQTESPPYILFSFVESDHDLILREIQSNKADAVGVKKGVMMDTGKKIGAGVIRFTKRVL